jgi:hypothetical protein
MNRRSDRIRHAKRFGSSIAVLAALLATALPVAGIDRGDVSAQGTAPAAESSLAAAGYPEFRIVATDDGPRFPASVAAGRLLVTLENQSTARSDVTFIQLPAGITLADLDAAFVSSDGIAPDWLSDIVSTGGFNVDAGQTGYGVLDLTPGEWLIGIGDDNPFVPLTVTGDDTAASTDGADPDADVTFQLDAHAIDLPEQLPDGQQVWHGINASDDSHEMMLIKTPELLTPEQVIAAVSAPEDTTPAPDQPDPATFEFVAAGLKTMSSGHEIWVELDLEPGYYVAICLSPDTETGAPHALLGELDIFTVGEPTPEA